MMDIENQNNSSSTGECIILSASSPNSTPSNTIETPKRSTSNVRLSKAESVQRKSEREAKKAEEDAIKAEAKRLKDELKAKKAEEIQLEKARKAEELQQEKARKAEEKARKEAEIQLEKTRKAEELQLEKTRKAEEKARKEAEIASKRAEQIQKKEQKQAAAQKQEMAHKQMANYMDKFFKPLQKGGPTSTTNSNNINQRCTDDFDQMVSKQDANFVSDIIETIKSMEKPDTEINSRSRLNSDSNSNNIMTTTTNNPYVIKTRYIHFPEKYFNRPPYYGTFKKALSVNINPLQPDAPIDNVDYTVDSEGEWEEPCKDGEELRSEADDLSDSEIMDSESDTDSFIVPHGHLSDDELNEDEQQQSISTKQAREAAKSHIWDKKVARLNQQRELKPIFGCIHDQISDEKIKFELSNYLHQFQRICVPKEICQRVEPDDKEQEITDETVSKEEKPKKVARKKSLILKKGLATDQQQQQGAVTPTLPAPTAKRTSSVSITVEGASPSKRRKVNSNENCSMIDDLDVIMIDIEGINPSKTNILEDASNVSEIKSSPLTIISNDDIKLDSTPTCTLLIPKRKQPPV